MSLTDKELADMTNPARDLAATGTQGEWVTRTHPVRHVRAYWYDERGRRCSRVRAVNALPAIADLLDHRIVAVWQERPAEFTFRCSCGFIVKHQSLGGLYSVRPDSILECPAATAARDRVAAALTGDAS